jgi:hypothetical protein
MCINNFRSYLLPSSNGTVRSKLKLGHNEKKCLKGTWLQRKCHHIKITKTSQKVHISRYAERGVSTQGERTMKIGKLLTISYFLGMAAALLAMVLFSSIAAASM